ncbi:hypothetical protein AVEN_106835-1 [Araneus ventricosus]|uniref:Uncharacterized protein n=1 Tax=Araneus ventricosus TaxID=182803 RepID=A0A4Y2PUZ2_ARAVE|nr:hypothetical protein AVEN_106835-1 [Araneus ventricosus]
MMQHIRTWGGGRKGNTNAVAETSLTDGRQSTEKLKECKCMAVYDGKERNDSVTIFAVNINCVLCGTFEEPMLLPSQIFTDAWSCQCNSRQMD